MLMDEDEEHEDKREDEDDEHDEHDDDEPTMSPTSTTFRLFQKPPARDKHMHTCVGGTGGK